MLEGKIKRDAYVYTRGYSTLNKDNISLIEYLETCEKRRTNEKFKSEYNTFVNNIFKRGDMK